MLVQTKDQPTRNSLCPCGSGKKYKLCCADNQADDHPLLQAAREYYAQRAFAEAEGKCRELLRRAPAHCGALHLLGLALEQQQKHNEAYEAYRSALALAPGTVNLWSDFAELLQTMGRLDEAADAYRQALHCAPNSPAIMVCLGTVLRTLGDLPAALEYHQRAMQLQPDAVEALMNTGSILHALGRDEEAKVHYQRALSLKPDYGYAHYNLGNLLMAHDQFEEGLACYQRTIELLPDYADAYNNLGVAFKRLKHPEEAAECYRRALKLQPDYAEAHYNLGEVLYTLGDVDAAYLAFQRHVALRPEKTAGELTKMAFIQPVIPQSLEEISVSRQRLVGTLEQIAASGLRLEDPYIEVGTLPFYLAYQGLDNRAIQETIARYFLTVCPALDWTAPHCRTSRPAGKRLRIGLASTCFYNHAVGKLTRGLIEHFSREQCEIVLLRAAEVTDAVGDMLDRAADSVVKLPNNLVAARERIAAEELDVLCYPDITPLTYYLSFARLAPVQCTTWGIPDTTGVPNMDYFLSAEALESEQADAQYSEQLVRLGHLPTYWYRPTLPDPPITRAHFGLPEEAHLYVCPQSLFKFHPDFDAALATILRRDPAGLLILLAVQPHWDQLLCERFVRSMPDVMERIIIFPGVSAAEYLGLQAMADALLDTPHFGGGTSSLDAMATGAPFITWPGQFMRGRISAACYQLMGLSELVAADGEAYVDLALRAGTDRAWREEVRARIIEHSARLYENRTVVREMESFFACAVEAAGKGERITWRANTAVKS